MKSSKFLLAVVGTGNRSYNDANQDDWRYRGGGGYNDSYDRRYGNYKPAHDNGYRDGLTIGQRDSEK